ncbi:MAG TPA: PKD domain-containing protein [Thermoplasmata archaeon]|nr:PKD domain-containing protein [Thermoplasmata archaeon]
MTGRTEALQHAKRASFLVILVLGLFLISGLVGGLAPRGVSSPSASGARASLGVAGLSQAPSPAVAPASGTENTTVTGTPAWANITDTAGTPPSARSYGRSFAYDPHDGYLLLFGGYTGGGYLADTWTFHNGTWKQLTPSVHPSARDHGTLAWDPLDGYMLLFGGSGNGGAYSDTWTFLNGTWTQLSPTSHPSARWASSMTWDAGDNQMLLFGGCAGAAVGDTWTYISGNWTQLSPTNHPSVRENTALRYDAALNATILFGGDDYGSTTYSDTWEFQAGAWTKFNGTLHPSGRTEASIAYDAAISAMVLFGGSGAAGNLGDTWLFEASGWVPVFPFTAPPARYFGEMAYDPSDGTVILYGGVGSTDFTDTWAFAGMILTASAANPTGPGPLSVSFAANTTNATGGVAYAWLFGDGNGSSGAQTSHTYIAPGEYYASVTATSGNGSQATATFVVRVAAPLSADAFLAPTSGPAPLTVSGSVVPAGGTAPYTVQWSAGAGTNSSAAFNATFTYDAPAAYVATVTVHDASGTTWSTTFHVTVGAPTVQPLSSEILSSTLSGPAPLPVWFASTMAGGVGPYAVNWSFGDGTYGTGASVDHVFSTAGTLTTMLTVTDAKGHTSSNNVTVTVGPALSATGSAPPRTVAGTSSEFSASVSGGMAPYTVTWAFGDGTAAVTANVSHSYVQAGTYNATFTVTDHRGISVSSSFSVLVTPAATSGGHNATPAPSSSGSAGMLDDADVVALAILGGAAMIAVAAIVVRRMDQR